MELRKTHGSLMWLPSLEGKRDRENGTISWNCWKLRTLGRLWEKMAQIYQRKHLFLLTRLLRQGKLCPIRTPKKQIEYRHAFLVAVLLSVGLLFRFIWV